MAQKGLPSVESTASENVIVRAKLKVVDGDPKIGPSTDRVIIGSIILVPSARTDPRRGMI